LFIAGINDIGDNLFTGVNDIGYKLSSVPTTPFIKLFDEY
jgi:hypothetical protein